MNQPTTGQQRFAQVDIDFAVDLLNRGESPKAVHGQLVERGLAPEDAAELLHELYIQAIYAGAVALLNQGHSADLVKQKLVERGLEQATAASVVNEILVQHCAAQFKGVLRRQEEMAGRVMLRILGGLVFVIGIGLYIGNRTGIFPTFPYAGFIAMGIGGLIWGAAESM
jgi:hypothetical protein